MPERIALSYKNCSEKFTQSPDYKKQYCSIYLSRLKDMEPLLVGRIQRKWGDQYPICQLHKLTEQTYDKVIVIGTLFKDQKLKPSVLKRLAEGNQLMPQPLLTHFTDESDALYMEDEVQRYQILNLDHLKLVTGITCALLGSDVGKGKFQVNDFVFASFRTQIDRPVFTRATYVLFLSGLDFTHQEKHSVNLQLLTYWIGGLLGDSERVSQVCRVIIAGNSISTEPTKAKTTISMVSKVNDAPDSIEAVEAFDEFLLHLCQLVDVDVMPGQYDPSNHILPQKPMHFCMYPQSAQYKSFNQVSNPYKCQIGGLSFTGTSGQPIKDIMRFSEVTDSLEALQCCLEWNHLAPTAPDTLGCFPFYQNDPFIIEECPHVFFAGNQEKFASKMVQGDDNQEVCLISLPEFSQTHQGVLLNLESLICHTVSFETK
ncbi:unnamed protein product [Ceutorhynchus assimilis]|uniref:DNA polymerase delta subunit 2 n=1 Tax=Ceutorhynchus assimilis TaxID=467358 RepID=A0A9N9QNQ4_9CUCU|nr:unnamed protein product [Ceutorhynchus assimilis]